MRPLLDLDLLRTLVAVEDAGSITRAASRVGRTQAAASMQLRRLEELVGRPLLRRTAVGTGFTPAGEALLRHARRILRAQDEAWTELVEPDLTGIVRLGLPDDYAGPLLPQLLHGFAVRNPLVATEVICEPTPALRARLRRGDLDVALLTDEAGAAGTADGRGLRREDLVWVCTADKSGAPWAADTLPLALSHPDAPDRRLVLAALDGAGRAWRVLHESGTVAGLLAMVRAGAAVAVLARCAVPPDLRLLGIGEGLPRLPQISIKMRVASRPPSVAALRLADHIATVLPALEPQPRA